MRAIEVIEERKLQWEENRDIEKDLEFRELVAKQLIEDEELLQEIKEYPEYLVEMVFVIVDKDKNTVPFFINEVQRDFINRINKAKKEYNEGLRHSIKFLVLKGRQQGFTSFITAYQLACTIMNENFEGFTAADEDGNTGTIFENKAKFPYSRLPDLIKPTEKYNNKKQLLFEKLHSSWEVKTASKNMGRSRTINFFHGSEAAFWKDPISDIQAGLGEALTKNAIQILESTANGYNEYKDLWDSGKWENCFYEWWQTEEYRNKFATKELKQQFINSVKNKEDWIYNRCKWLHETIELDWEQIHWYYNKYQGYINPDHIKQEYPCSEDEAFLASGKCIFDKEKIIQRKEVLKRKDRKIKYGYFEFEWNNPKYKDFIKEETIRFVETKENDIKAVIRIYEEVKKGYPYVLGGDTKGEGKDSYAGQVINNVSGNRAATLKMNVNNSKPYTWQMYCLGVYYNTALISIEINFNTAPIEELERLHYPRQYQRERYDSFTGDYKKAYGWKTDGTTRPLIIDKEVTLVEENIDLFNDIETLDQMLTFVEDKNGRPDAESGKHDDLLLADMIGQESRKQQTYVIDDYEEIIDDDEDFKQHDDDNWFN